jgi:hypothetical protein
LNAAKRLALGCFVVLLLALLSVTIERVAERGRFARALSSYGSGPEGVRGLYLLLAELGFPVLRWSQDLAHLPAGATLVALGDCKTGMVRPLSRYERDELLRWVGAGGVLVVAGARHYLPPGIGVSFAHEAQCPEAGAAAPAASDGLELPDAGAGAERASDAGVPAADGGTVAANPADQADAGQADAGGLAEFTKLIVAAADNSKTALWAVPVSQSLQGLPIVQFRSPGQLRLAAELPGAETLLAVPPPLAAELPDTASELVPLALTVARGKGRLVVLASANMLQNDELQESEGATLFVRLLRAYGNPGPVIFDEYHLGLGDRRSLMSYLRQLGVLPLVAQLLLVVFCILWRAGARFGAIQRPVAAPAAGTTSFVTALGGLYRNVGDAPAAVRLIARAALARIASHHAVSSVQAATLERELAARGAERARQAVLNILAAVSSSRVDALPAIVQRIDAAVAEALADAREPPQRKR